MYFCADMRSILYYKGFLVVFLLIFFQPSMNFGVLASALAKSVEEQQPNEPTDKIKFDSYKFDFGDIAEDGGEVEHKFTFTNLTGKPVVILDVATGCGCTTPNFSRKPVLHGQQGEIVIVFDPMTRPGRFTKGVMVYTSVSTNGISLTIEGNVLPRKKTLEEEYPFDLGGGVRITSNYHSFAYISRGEKIQQSIGWVNTSTKDATFKAVAKEQSGLLTIDAPAVMKAGQRGEFVISYFVPEGSKRYGTMAACPEHGNFFVRIRLAEEDGGLKVSRLIYEADSEVAKSYEAPKEPPKPKEKARVRRRRRKPAAEP